MMKLKNHEIHALIFDLDGTLIDSMNIWADIDRIFLEQLGLTYTDEISQNLKNLGFQKGAMYLIDQFNLAMTVEEINAYSYQLALDAYRNKIPLKKGVKELLEWLKQKNIPMCIGTANHRELAEVVCQRLEILPYFDFILTTEEIHEGKESPKLILECANQLKTSPSKVLLVEDNLISITTALQNGFLTCGIYDELSRESWNQLKEICHVYAKYPSDLLTALKGDCT